MADVRLVDESNEKEFVDYMSSQNYRWFNRGKKHSLQHKYKNYIGWTLLYDNNKIVAFAGMQHFKYLDNTVRVCTRLYYDPSIRYQYTYSTKNNIITPVTPLMLFQLKYLQDSEYDTAVATLENHRGKKFMEYMARNLNKKIGTNFLPHEKPIQTFEGQNEKDYQWYMTHRLKEC